MQKSSMYFDNSKAKIYKDSYRPSSNLSHFVRSVFSIILVGQSPVSKASHYQIKKSR